MDTKAELNLMKKVFEVLKNIDKDTKMSVLRSCMYVIDENWREKVIKEYEEEY